MRKPPRGSCEGVNHSIKRHSMPTGLVISLLLLLALLASSCTGSPEQGESVAVERETANATHEATSDETVDSTVQTTEGDPVQSAARAAEASRGKPGSARAQAPGPNNPAVPNAKGVQIAFSGEGGIEVINADGSDRRSLGPGADPGWSRDGKLIAVTDGDGGDIRVMNADGSGLRALGVAGFSPTWSPDGGQLAFARDCHGHQSGEACWAERATWPTDPAEDCGPECGIGLVARDGTGGVRHLGDGIWPEWGPDGRIIFADGVPTQPCYYDQGYSWTRGRDSEDGRSEGLPPCELPLWVMKADGSGRTRLPIEKAIRPTWSHDGRRIAYATAQDGVFIANFDGTAIRKVAPAGYSQPSWSPDGLWLALKRQTTSDYQGEGNIYLRTIDGSTEIRLTSGRWDSQPAFSPLR
ncbi:MAG TPA: hypothetical protein VND22_08420 [Actinomycetota bacterium]|nr:hypothetical protein [Actinomycetota bacterium]